VPWVRLESEGPPAYKHRLKAGLLDNQRGEHVVSPEADWGCSGLLKPFIIQLSKGARPYANKRMSEVLIQTAKDIWPDAIFAVQAADKPQSFSIRGA